VFWGVGIVIVSQYSGVGQQNLCLRKGVGYAFLGHHFSKRSSPTPTPYLLTGPLFRIFDPTFVIGKTPDDLKVALVTPGCKTLEDIKNHKFFSLHCTISSSLQETESFKVPLGPEF